MLTTEEKFINNLVAREFSPQDIGNSSTPPEVNQPGWYWADGEALFKALQWIGPYPSSQLALAEGRSYRQRLVERFNRQAQPRPLMVV